MDEDSTNFGAGVVQHFSKLHTILRKGLGYLSSICRAHLFWDIMVPHPMLSVSAQRYLVHSTVPKALGEALLS